MVSEWELQKLKSSILRREMAKQTWQKPSESG
jgi:hypothetical protein